MDYDQLSVGDYVSIRLRDGMNPRQFGGTLRTGNITDFGIDILESELQITLDDGGPAIYASYIVGIVRHASAAVPASRNVR